MTISFQTPAGDHRHVAAALIRHVEELLKDFYLELNGRKTRIIDLNISNHVRITGLNLVRDDANHRKLTVGRKGKDELFYNALDALKQGCGPEKIQKIKGMQSFLLSVEGEKYENTYSDSMQQIIEQLGFPSLKSLIDSL